MGFGGKGVSGYEPLVVWTAFPDTLMRPTAVGALGWICTWLFTIQHLMGPRACPAPGLPLTVLISVRVVQATGAYRWPPPVFWLYRDPLGQDFGKRIDLFVRFGVGEFY